MITRFLGGEAFLVGLRDREGQQQFGDAFAQIKMTMELLQQYDAIPIKLCLYSNKGPRHNEGAQVAQIWDVGEFVAWL